jgi:recombination protein RecA
MAVKKQEADDRLAALLASDAMQKFSKKHGESILLRGNDLKDHVKNVVRIPSGIFSLDYALAGGWPVGRVHVVYGEKSSGKTTTLLKTIANIQKLCANCWKYVNPDWTCPCGNYLKPTTAYLDVEGAVDYGWARTLGIECNDVLWSTPEFAEEALDLMDLTLRSGMIDVLILDSLAFLAPSAEIEKSVQKASVSIGALLVNKAS